MKYKSALIIARNLIAQSFVREIVNGHTENTTIMQVYENCTNTVESWSTVRLYSFLEMNGFSYSSKCSQWDKQL